MEDVEFEDAMREAEEALRKRTSEAPVTLFPWETLAALRNWRATTPEMVIDAATGEARIAKELAEDRERERLQREANLSEDAEPEK